MELCTGESQKINGWEKIESIIGRNREGDVEKERQCWKWWNIEGGTLWMEQYTRGVHMYRRIRILSDGLYDY